MGKLLGKPLAWLASFGTGMVSALLFYLLGLIGVAEGTAAPVVWGFITVGVTKFVGWLVATYGPTPTEPAEPRAICR
jgi:hypothetical protein